MFFLDSLLQTGYALTWITAAAKRISNAGSGRSRSLCVELKKVLLINSNTERTPYPVPPVGICLVAASVPPEFQVEVFDGTFGGGDRLKAEIHRFQPDYIGLGIRNIDDVTMGSGVYFAEEILEGFVRSIREASQAPLILGGSGFSIFPQPLLELFDAQFGIIGEGEEAFPALLNALVLGGDPCLIPGVLTRDKTMGLVSAKRNGHERLAVPFSRIDTYIDYRPYRDRGSYPIQTKRGCRHRCVYCTYATVEGSRYRLRAAKEVVDEIEDVANRLGDVVVELVDSTFNDPPGHAEGICRELIKRKLKVRLRTMGVNPAGVTDELIGLMRQAGFSQMDCTPDSASASMLVSFRKNFSRERLEEAAQYIVSHDMPTMWFFIFGGPGETEETVLETFDFVDRFVGPDDMVHMTAGIRINPGTELQRIALEQGLIGADDKLLEPRFYVSPHLGARNLNTLLSREAASRPNCVNALDSKPSAAMLKEALKMRSEEGIDEPMFRSLLRVRRRHWKN